MPEQKTVALVDSLGVERPVPESEVEYRLGQGWKHQTAEGRVVRLSGEAEEEKYGGIAGQTVAGVTSALGGFTGGGSDALLAATDAGDHNAKARRHNEATSIVGGVVGGLLPGGAGGIAERIGAKVAGAGGGTLAQIARAGVSGAVEGGIQGIGQGISELALSDDPLTIERIASTLGSNALYGGVAGGVANVAAKGLERGLTRAKAALEDVGARPIGSLGEIPEDLAGLDRKGLRAAEAAEKDAIEAARIPKRAEVADEIKAFRKELKEQKLWLATKGSEDAEIRAIGKRTLKADRALDNVLDDPKALAENPRAALSNLRKQEAALDDLVNKHGPKLRELFAADTSGTRAASLDFAEKALERNRSLQSKISELSAAPASPRLQAIADATEALSAPRPPKGMVGELLGGSVFGHVSGAFSGLAIVGPMLGAKAAKAVSGLFENGGKLGGAAKQAAERGAKAVGAFLDVTRKVQPAAPVIASKVLSAARFGEEPRARRQTRLEQAQAAAKVPPLDRSFKARTRELREAVQPTPSGSVVTRPDVRQRIARQLAPIAAASPIMADRLETLAARRIEFLASKMPRRPDAFGAQIGPDTWQPSEMEMRTWARYVAAAEDPGAVVERLADGSVTPEDAETMRAVYPEMFADIQQQILEQLPVLRATLPYQRRLAFSVFSGVPVDPALDPQVLTALQASFANEDGTEGGTQAPRAQPAFGSVSKPDPTPAQQRGL